MENYRYFKDCDGKVCRIHIERDEQPWNPRYDMDGNIGHMMCWWNRYELGDYKENNYSEPEDFVNDLVRKYVSEKTIINYIKAKKTSNGLELKYNRSECVWELWGYYRYWWTGSEVHHGIIASYNPLEYLIDDIIDAMSFEDKWKLLKRNGIECLPLNVYEHGGITMRTSGFSCPWDSGQAGWIYTTKKDVLECGGKIKSKNGNWIKVTDRNWRCAARLWMEDEVDMYDQYLQGDCYGYIIDELDMDDQASLENGFDVLEEDDMNWDEHTDSCWGFYSSKWGSDLVEEIAKEVTSNKLFETIQGVFA